MAAKTTLNATNLEALGAERLAALLIEISTGDANAKRRLRLELAHRASPQSAAHEIRKRLTAIANAKSSISWRKRKSVLEDLEMQRRAIVETIGASDPGEALDLLWRYVALANGVHDRGHDGSGTISAQFEKAIGDLAELATRVGPPREALARQVFTAISENEYGQFENLIAKLAPALGAEGLEELKRLLEEWKEEPVPEPKGKRRIIGYALGGGEPRPVYEEDYTLPRKRRQIDEALRDIADATGDVDSFIAQHSEIERTIPQVAAEIARRLLRTERPKDAMAALDAVLEDPRELLTEYYEEEWEEAYMATLEALGQSDKAQSFRWDCFEARLDVDRLKDYIKRLPDFEDVEAEEKALTMVFEREEPHEALEFFIRWPDLKRAERLVLDPHKDWNGDAYEVLTPAGEALAPSHPLAATRLLREMITFTLDRGKSSRYKHAARHLDECAALAGQISNFGFMPHHDDFVMSLREKHGRKRGFWNRVESDVDL